MSPIILIKIFENFITLRVYQDIHADSMNEASLEDTIIGIKKHKTVQAFRCHTFTSRNVFEGDN